MGSPLGPLLANVFYRTREGYNTNVNWLKVMPNNCQYVDNTLLLDKDEDIDPILQEVNSYDKNIKFTVDRFINEKVHF